MYYKSLQSYTHHTPWQLMNIPAGSLFVPSEGGTYMWLDTELPKLTHYLPATVVEGSPEFFERLSSEEFNAAAIRAFKPEFDELWDELVKVIEEDILHGATLEDMLNERHNEPVDKKWSCWREIKPLSHKRAQCPCGSPDTVNCTSPYCQAR